VTDKAAKTEPFEFSFEQMPNLHGVLHGSRLPPDLVGALP
jgi:hypothetical protein